MGVGMSIWSYRHWKFPSIKVANGTVWLLPAGARYLLCLNDSKLMTGDNQLLILINIHQLISKCLLT